METFENNGAFKINDAWVTRIRFQAKISEGQIEKIDVQFMNNRNQITKLTDIDRTAALDILGENNIKTIESGKENEGAEAHDISKGKLEGQSLSFKESFTPDFEVNEIQAGTEKNITSDAEIMASAMAAAARRRQSLLMTRQNNQAVASSEKDLVDDVLNKEKPSDKEQTDKDLLLPADALRNFDQVEGKFYFKDSSLAFEDKGAQLRARAEHREVVKALVAISQHRGWESITVKGTATFKQAVWMEASKLGIEVKGYKPTELDKVKLQGELKNIGSRERADSSPENVVIKGIDRSQTTSDIDHSGAGASALSGDALKLVSGKLIDHGAANYKHEEHTNKSYWAKIQTEKGEQTIWGIDLKRALEEGNLKPGDNVNLQYMGSKPVVATENVVKDGQVVDVKSVDTHRNRWEATKVEDEKKAAAFKNKDPVQAVAEYPELTGAVAARHAAQQLGEKKGSPHFAKEVEDQLAKDIAAGKPITAPMVAERKVREVAPGDKKKTKIIAKEKKQDKELER